MDFVNKSFKFLSEGISTKPADLIPSGKFFYLQNVRSTQEGALETRPGITKIIDVDGVATSPLHSIHRLDNPTDSTYSYITGASTKLYSTFLVSGATNATPIVITADRIHALTTGDSITILGVLGNTAANGTWTVTVTSTTAFSLNTSVGNAAYTSGGIVCATRDTGYSGDPLNFIHHQPARSPEPWLYIGDSSRMRKINSKGQDYAWGIAPFNSILTAALSQASYKTVSDFENTTESAVAWTNAGTAGAISAVARLSAVAVTAVIYDTGTTGWASVVPGTFTDSIQPGIFVTTGVTTAETALIDSVYDPIFNTTIGSVAYDSGSTGLCTVQLVVPTFALCRDALVFNSTQTQRVRVLSVTEGPNGISSFRVDTGATTWAATNAIQGQRTFRAYFANTHDATTTLSTNHFRFSNTVGTGYINHVLARDLSNTGAAGRPVSGDDFVHISLRFDDLSLLTEGRIMLDVDGSTNDFTRNFYYYEFRPNDLTGAVLGSTTGLSNAQILLARREIQERVSSPRYRGDFGDNLRPMIEDIPFEDIPYPTDIPPGQTGTGNNQWSEVKIKVSDLKRVGADSSRTLRDVAAIRVQVKSTGTLQVDCDAWWVGGTYGLDLPDDQDAYLYRARPRSSTTGAIGNPSPPIRTGLRPHRQSVTLSITAHPDAQVDQVDWFRTGGNLLDWYYVGSSANSGTPSFIDEYSEEIVKFNPILEFDNFQPFPVIDTPKSGVCNVVGSVVTRVSGDTFNTSWAEGSLITVDGIECTLYSSPSSTSRLEITESLGTRSSVTFYLSSPTKLAQPMAAVFGPYALGDAGSFIFGCKDGTLYWTKSGDPDSASDINSLRVTSGSESLIQGCIYDGRPYLFSDRKMYQITPLPTDEGGVSFQVAEVAHGVGLWSIWGITVGDHIYFVGKNGVYASNGGAPTCITSEDLYPIFPHDGQTGSNITGSVRAIDYTIKSAIRLSTIGAQLYLDFKNTGGTADTLMFDTRYAGWIADAYTPRITIHQASQSAGSYETLIGGSTGILYTLSGVTDDGNGISGIIKTPATDFGDPRLLKLFGDYALDVDTGGATLNVTPSKNSYRTDFVADSISVGAGRGIVSHAFNGAITDEDVTAQSMALGITWNANGSALPKFYGWSFSAVVKPESTLKRATDWTDAGYPGPKWVQGVRFTANTFGLAKTVEVQYDGGTVGATLTVNHATETRVGYPNTASPTFEPFIATLVRLAATDSNPWRIEEPSVEWIFEPEPELATYWKTQGTTHDQEDFHFVRELRITLRSTATVTLTINVDGTDYTYTLASTSGNQRMVRVTPQSIKGKIFQYTLSSAAGFRVYKKDCSVLVKRVKSPDYSIQNPFGDISRISGARI